MTKLVERTSELATIRALLRRGGLLVVEGGAGVGKTALLDRACAIADQKHRIVLRGRGFDLERDFAFGIVRQLFERYCADASKKERAELFAGLAHVVRALLLPELSRPTEGDTSFAVLHGLYWLTVNLTSRGSVLIAVDDAHWADDASARWLAHLGPRLAGPLVSLIVAVRSDEPRSQTKPLVAVRAAATAIIRPTLLSERGVAAIARRTLGSAASDDICTAVHNATGGNPFYVFELLRALQHTDQLKGARVIEDVINRGGIDGVALQLAARLRNLDPPSLRLAQAITILGERCELRHAAAISQMTITKASHVAAELVRLEVLAEARPPRFVHPIVEHAVARTLSAPEQEAGHRTAARMLYAEHSYPGRLRRTFWPYRQALTSGSSSGYAKRRGLRWRMVLPRLQLNCLNARFWNHRLLAYRSKRSANPRRPNGKPEEWLHAGASRKRYGLRAILRCERTSLRNWQVLTRNSFAGLSP